MTKLRYMTPEEEDRPILGLADEKTGEIALRRGSPSRKSESLGRTIRHELGHIKYPVEITWGPVEEPINWEEFNVKDLFRELGASYYALTLQSRDSVSRSLIRELKRQAREEGLTLDMIARIDKVARERVGYTGREVK